MTDKKANRLRIIGGRMRGRKISFPDLPDIRPTPDRVRETLFNWLQLKIVDSVCLDLFCGSGALGLEAISRGARSVLAVDKEKQVVDHLKKIRRELNLENYHVHQHEIPFDSPLKKNSFDIVFLDPPFRQDLASLCLDWILQNQFLKSSGLVYLETEKDVYFGDNSQWNTLREKYAGQVCYRLLQPVLNRTLPGAPFD